MKKYWVPAIERADAILQLIASNPGKLKLIDMANQLEINKSSMFSLLKTMEALQWVVCEKDSTYSLGTALGTYGNAYFEQFSFAEWFYREAVVLKESINETIQLAKLDHDHVLYLSKVEADSPVRLITEPGMKLPAYVTALGKALLASLPPETVDRLYPETLKQNTEFTIATKEELLAQLEEIRTVGYALDLQESVIGFCCIAAPVFNRAKEAVYAVSVAMPSHHWESKREQAKQGIVRLAQRLSFLQ